ncbi:zinc metalloprotease HtpX [Candidatus Uhrbacteria bacterium CG_4_10_14_0_8_um_filter_58_22]|uniref:Protease HtpX homolog n=1 Tax=Candidatus Uhrbacteria bacterium CG_4_10_14_0_8_um_filter_58_22 TaxID=1975029 RepID=A0A2M7QBL5_9BACT|nr:MAG: zinc metalloprotease HtpX [Parcubacteria group bacterium CG1_02_58_44]PIY63155.1 MAG: zinc metalloprotease HtpX [Candidatus Uhrbacteria bacterium CG_4_10_14_0_8_um_filter_58_22]
MTTYDFIASNRRKSALLIAVFGVLVMVIGWLADQLLEGGGLYLILAAGYSIVTAVVGFYSGDRLALSMSGAHEVSEKDNPYLVRMVQNLCITTGTPMPRVHVIDDPAINAFATGRDPKHSSIAVTTGAIRLLENEELEGVLAHELSHVRNYDIRVMTLVMVLAGTIVIVADLAMRSFVWGGRRRRNGDGNGAAVIIGLILMLIAPLVAQLIKLAVSRRREYLADASAALITRFPNGLARALQKIQVQSQPMQSASGATAHLFIANPFSGRMSASLFSTHPPIESRIAALHRMSGPTGA